MKSLLSTPIQKHHLFCPGPVNAVPAVKDAVHNEIGHREPEFSVLLTALQQKVLSVFGVTEQDGYHAVIVTGSGTAANETVISSVVGDQHILIISNGEFGERLVDLSNIHNPNTHHLKFEWAQPFNLKKIEKYLKENPVDIIAMVHHETSTGMLNPIAEVGALANQYGKQFIIDTVSSAGAELIDLKACHVSFCTTSASKAICSLPGVAMVVGREADFERLADMKPRTMYLNLYKFYRYSKDYHQTPNTPAVQSFFALDAALDHLLRHGMKAVNTELQARAAYLRQEMKSLGLQFLIDESLMSCVLTTVLLPEGFSAEAVRNKLREDNIIIYGGKGPISGRVFQVANIGAVDRRQLKHFVRKLSAILAPAATSKIIRSRPLAV